MMIISASGNETVEIKESCRVITIWTDKSEETVNKVVKEINKILRKYKIEEIE